jgi:GT2 family glycosyltransferase
MRTKPLLNLLNSVKVQTTYPDEILIIDGSSNKETQLILEVNTFENLNYYKVSDENRGLTKQRNFGISMVSDAIDIVCFLDDDTVLEKNYFEEILKTYTIFPNALGVGGYISNEVVWEKKDVNYQPKIDEFFFDGWKRKEGSRFVIRKLLGLDTLVSPGFMPKFGHGKSIGFLPPTGKIYEVEQFMGGVASFKKEILKEHQFSTYFEGYGLYEDADYTLRISKIGKLYVTTNAKLSHFHDDSGRPNFYFYGKMVIRNGWYVWRIKNPSPNFLSRFKWNAIAFLLTVIRFINIFTIKKRKEAFMETVGRIVGWWSLIFNKPKKSI